ncbi:Mucin-associated surface protein (MASP) [Trypanosoma cruzi]|uniref:Mucin-associated surface protein (MASP), putative n=2 Tax=Trypanosoma cruzi TaxID=5693 RepID=Q4E236_TRYCC|nr:mucin-associated surface protein (MASP), putative [Trypanosoma cruzi]EAN98833.1 mucin-associated surface protein (MASP), putative [Trypanosoma cruzi]PWV19810.1 Mucin-associated surface protein (MASP) [Trypanosoma cruzi]RNC54586.1 mucin-associated surface protein (MASP) [Trypanosoma cruzi]|eukprot:XP_820684.1 mucin-associated surface protein (MASP) [Trypanosoma cruzi strain CL Brener]
MAMMMTGRVLLVCALCVLWSGAGGRCDVGEAAGLRSAELPPAPAPLEKSPEGPKGLQGGVPGVKENVTPASSIPTEEEHDYEEDDSDDDEEVEDTENGETEEEEEKRKEGQSNKGGTVAPDPNSGEKNLIGSEKETGQSISSAGSISPSGSRESNANLTQPEVEEKKETEKNTPAVENPPTTVNGENTLLGGIAGGNLPSPSEEGVDSREKDGKDTTSEGEKNVPPPATAATPQGHRDKGSEGTEEDTKATTVTANTTDTTNTQNSDSSTAASHTTSPLLLLLVVACAAAAVVVAA